MDIVSRLKEYISHLQMPVTQFADTANIPRPTFSQLLNGRNKKVSDELIGKIHTAFPELNIMWLLFGENQMIEKEAILSASNGPQFTHNSPAVQTNDPTIPPVVSAESIKFSEHVPTNSETTAFSESSAGVKENESQTSRVKSLEPDDFDLDSITDTQSEDVSADPSSINFDNESPNPVPRRDCSRKIVNIIVYYSDNSFESFTPDVAEKFIGSISNPSKI